MAYNREWDQGKETWHGNEWHGTGGGTHVRPREEEYYGEGKRRKYNNGGFQGYDTSQAYEEYGSDKGFGQGRPSGDHQHDQGHGHDDRRGGGFSGKKRLVPSEPSPHVIFLGLDPDFTEADLQAYLTTHGCSVETVTIIRDRSTGLSKGFGFAQFTTTEHARAFVDPLFPFIQVPPPASHGASATAAFYKAQETGLPHNGRRVKIDFSQSATPHDKGRFNRGNTNDGTRDIGNTQGPVLLFRGLDPLSGPQAIYQAMLYSSGTSGPNQKGPKGMRRIILIKDKVTMASFGFAFVEFVDVPSASAVLAATMSPTIHPSGFRISDKPVAASFAHPYSFQPVTDFLSRDEACLQSTNSLGGAPGQWVRYWDESSTCAVLEFKVEEPAQANQPTKEKKEKKKKGDSDAALQAAPAPPSALPVSDKPVTLSFSKGPVKPTTTKPVTLGFSMDDVTGEDDEGDNAETIATVKKVAPLIASKKTASNISKWTQVQEELQNDSHNSTASAPVPSSVTTATASGATTGTSGIPPPTEDEFEFSDVAALMCLLCARQFKSLDQLKRHNKESDLHKKNFKDVNLREVAKQKLAARKGGIISQQQEPVKYRDRAMERRVLFNQPDTPVPEGSIGSAGSSSSGKYNGGKGRVEGPPAPVPAVATPPPPPPANPAEDMNNVGNKLLKMMGWTEGSGLGVGGEGRTEPIPTAVYAQGVGLGASKGKEIGKFADGYSGYVQMAQEAARERYGK